MGESVIVPACSRARSRELAGGGVWLGFWGCWKSPIGLNVRITRGGWNERLCYRTMSVNSIHTGTTE
jgi:hypothetical protein